MYYFPIVELIEKLVEWFKQQGGWVYWGWSFAVGAFGGFGVNNLAGRRYYMAQVTHWRFICVAIWYYTSLLVGKEEK